MSPIPVIAVVDDEVEVRRALSRLLGAYGYRVEGYPDGEALLDAAAHTAFDCVLVDLHLPGIPGLGVVEALRDLAPTTPVIVITGRDEPEYAERARALHVFGYERKPVGAPALLATLARACDAARGAAR